MLLAGGLEFANDAVAVGRGGINRHQVVVVKVDSPGADLGQHGHDVVGRDRRTDGLAKRIAAAVAQGPKPE